MYRYLKSGVSILLLFFFITPLFSQRVELRAYIINKPSTINSDTIFYNGAAHLAWNDFIGIPILTSFAGAVTASGFAYNADIFGNEDLVKINVYIYTFFVKSQSWRKPSVTEDYYLQHEQHHFDISRLGAQEFCNRLTKANFTIENYHAKLDEIFNNTFKENTAFQEKYDRETNHSIQKQTQLAWNQTIEKEVSKLK